MGDKHVLYVFGPTFKQINIQGTIYLKVCGGGDGIAAVNGFFNSARVSSSKRAVNVSLGGAKVGMYVTDLTFGQANAALNTITF